MARIPFEKPNINAMFDEISGNYDKLNALMTFGLYKQWRQAVVYALGDARPQRILDVATGTADMPILLANSIPSVKEIVGVDYSAEMLRIGEDKVKSERLNKTVRLLPCNAELLPFEDETFDSVTCAFGIRNFAHRERALSEMLRVLRPGGRLCILELSIPRNRLLRIGYNAYTNSVIPFLGKHVAKNEKAYQYLTRSIKAMPQYERMVAIIQSVGFTRVRFRALSGGTATLFEAMRSSSTPLIQA